MLAPAAPVTHLESATNIELDEVVQDVSDDALELAAGGGDTELFTVRSCFAVHGC